MCPSSHFHVYQFVSLFTVHGKKLFEEGENVFIVSKIANNSKKDKIVHNKLTCFNGDINIIIS